MCPGKRRAKYSGDPSCCDKFGIYAVLLMAAASRSQ
jgi:hypothetical protein